MRRDETKRHYPVLGRHRPVELFRLHPQLINAATPFPSVSLTGPPSLKKEITKKSDWLNRKGYRLIPSCSYILNRSMTTRMRQDAWEIYSNQNYRGGTRMMFHLFCFSYYNISRYFLPRASDLMISTWSRTGKSRQSPVQTPQRRYNSSSISRAPGKSLLPPKINMILRS